MKITREKLLTFIRNAFPAELSHLERGRLLRAAQNAKRIAVGDFYVAGVGCPVAQAGLPCHGSAKDWEYPTPLMLFHSNFDYSIWRAGGPHVGVLEVI